MRYSRLHRNLPVLIVVAVLTFSSLFVTGIAGPTSYPRTVDASTLIPHLASGAGAVRPSAGSPIGNTTHTYSTGNCTANPTVQEHAGGTSYRNFPIDVPTPPPPPGLTVTISASPTTVGVNQTVSFTSSPSGGTPPYTFAWSFGDGGTAGTQNASHEYAHLGTYTASLRVQDSVGNVAEQNVTVTVKSASSATPSSFSNVELWIVGAIVTAVLVIFLVIVFRRRRKGEPASAAPAAGPVSPPPRPPAAPGAPPPT